MNVAGDTVKRTGKVWLVGAGPSEAGLMTVKGLNVLLQADVVVYDNLVGVEILNLIPSDVKIIDVGKRSSNHPVPQNEINHILLTEALNGNQVVRLKGGDPFLFGRGGEELELISNYNIPFEVIPGITSAISVPAYAGIPVTHRDYCSSLHIITGHTKEGENPDLDFEALVKMKGTLVFLMGISALAYICNGLIQAGMPLHTSAAVVENGTSSRQRKVISTLGTLKHDVDVNKIQAPSIIIVGAVCSLSSNLSWAEERPLHGIRVVVTRPERLCSKLSERIRGLGGEAIEFPCIKTIPLADKQAFDQAIDDLRSYDWLVLTSAIGVEALLERMLLKGKDIRELYGVKIAVVGSATAEAFRQRGIKIDFIPDNFNVRDLAQGLITIMEKGSRILILRAKEGSKDLNQILDQEGIDYEDIPVYQTVFDSGESQFSRMIIEKGDFEYACFTSALTVEGFVKALPDLNYSGIKALCIGEQTAKEALNYGMDVIISPEATLDSMIETLINLNS